MCIICILRASGKMRETKKMKRDKSNMYPRSIPYIIRNNESKIFKTMSFNPAFFTFSNIKMLLCFASILVPLFYDFVLFLPSSCYRSNEVWKCMVTILFVKRKISFKHQKFEAFTKWLWIYLDRSFRFENCIAA